MCLFRPRDARQSRRREHVTLFQRIFFHRLVRLASQRHPRRRRGRSRRRRFRPDVHHGRGTRDVIDVRQSRRTVTIESRRRRCRRRRHLILILVIRRRRRRRRRLPRDARARERRRSSPDRRAHHRSHHPTRETIARHSRERVAHAHIHSIHSMHSTRSVGRSVGRRRVDRRDDGERDGEMDGIPRRWDAEMNGTTRRR